MAVKIPLKMSDGAVVRTIEDLREHFDLEAVLGYYSSGRLAEWLEERYCEKEAAEVRNLATDAKNFNETLCAVLGVTYEKKAGDRRFGAAEILDKKTLWTIADQIGDRFIVLPSSVHEAIVLPPKEEAEYGRLADMVREVNDTQVDVEERLSDHVYVYSRDEEMLKIVA